MDDGYMGDGYMGEEYMGDGYMGDRYRPQPQVVYVEQQQPPKKSGGIGMGGLALGGSQTFSPNHWHNSLKDFLSFF